MVEFWQGALHYVPRSPARAGWVVLTDPEGRGPHLAFQARQARRPARSWLPLDLYTDAQEAEVERLLELGAKRYPWPPISWCWKTLTATSSASSSGLSPEGR